VSLSPSQPCPGCTINTSGYDFRKGHVSPKSFRLLFTGHCAAPASARASGAKRHGEIDATGEGKRNRKQDDHMGAVHLASMRALANCVRVLSENSIRSGFAL